MKAPIKNNFPKLLLLAAALGAGTTAMTQAIGQDGGQAGGVESTRDLLRAADESGNVDTSPVRRIERPNGAPPPRDPTPTAVNAPPAPLRAIDGSGNNPGEGTMNAAHTQLRRFMTPDYSDGISSLAGVERPGPREVSNLVSSQSGSILNPRGASDFLWQWGQFIDHDIDLTDGADPAEYNNIAIPTGDAFFDPAGSGEVVMEFNRSLYDAASGTSLGNPRQQLNEISGWLDASNVYGSDDERAAALRTNDGSGRLRTSAGNLLPFNTAGLANAGGSGDSLFLAGDVRANEQVGLIAMHTLFVREHNRLAAQIAAAQPGLSGEQIYQSARRMVAGQIQVITYNEFLPLLLGENALFPYQGYNPDIDARIMNEFSTGAYRLGHSLLSTQLLRLDAQGNEIADGHLALRDAFFAPYRIVQEGGIAPVLRGLAAQVCQNIDVYVIDDVRNFLFGAPGQGGFDLVALNVQRGRDHGLPSYNDAREAMGLPRARNFADVSSSDAIRQRLARAYGSVDAIDFWVGGLAEDHLPGALVGEMFYNVIRRQFTVLRDGDRFWYQTSLNPDELQRVENTTLAQVIRRNTNIGAELADDVFRVALPRPPRQGT